VWENCNHPVTPGLVIGLLAANEARAVFIHGENLRQVPQIDAQDSQSHTRPAATLHYPKATSKRAATSANGEILIDGRNIESVTLVETACNFSGRTLRSRAGLHRTVFSV